MPDQTNQYIYLDISEHEYLMLKACFLVGINHYVRDYENGNPDPDIVKMINNLFDNRNAVLELFSEKLLDQPANFYLMLKWIRSKTPNIFNTMKNIRDKRLFVKYYKMRVSKVEENTVDDTIPMTWPDMDENGNTIGVMPN